MTPALQALAARWSRRRRMAALLWGVALAAPVAAVGWRLGAVPGAVVAAAGGAALAPLLALLYRQRRGSLVPLARHLDRVAPPLEESAELLLRAPAELPPLARLQRRRAAAALEALRGPPALGRHGGRPLRRYDLLPRAPVRRASLAAIAGAALAALAALVPLPAPGVGGPSARPPSARAAGAAVAIGRVTATVLPPAYTGLEPREERGLSLGAPAGSRLRWRVAVEGAADAVALEAAGVSTPLTAEAAAGGALFTGESSAEETRLHRLVARRDGEVVAVSPYGRLEVVPDRPPELLVRAPSQALVTVAEGTRGLRLELEARDDYGLSSAVLVTTLAAGSGEMVTFHERARRLPLPAGARSHRLAVPLDLAAEGLGPGAELYARVEVRDNRVPQAQTARSPTWILRLPGGGGESVGLGRGLPVVEAPEMFRSQRQIILDTERLLREAPALTRQEVVRRSEELGLDQRALRLRYGVLLGDELVSGSPAGEEGHDHGGEEHPPGETAAPGDRWAGVPEGLMHRHDSAESATFFADEIRTTLKAALAAMWDAEGRLRGIEPRQALPYEYRALRLLKDVQHRSRVYVQRVGFEPPPLVEAERRLTGDLADVRSQLRRWAVDAADDGVDLPAAYARLGEESAGGELLPALGEARRRLASLALRGEGEAAATALQDVAAVDLLLADLEAGRTPPPARLQAARAALWRVMPPPAGAPRRPETDGGELASRYRQRLTEGRQ